MPYTDEDIKRVVRSHRGGTIELVQGPFTVCGLYVWEVWVMKEGEYDTRFVYIPHAATLEYLNGFADLCAKVSAHCAIESSKHKSIADALNARLEDIRHRSFILKISAIVFLACVAALLYLILSGHTVDSKVLPLFGALLASGAGMYFGKWNPKGLPSSP